VSQNVAHWGKRGSEAPAFRRGERHENDIATLIHAYKPAIPPLTKMLSAYVNENDLTEIENTLSNIQQRIERFQKRSS